MELSDGSSSDNSFDEAIASGRNNSKKSSSGRASKHAHASDDDGPAAAKEAVNPYPLEGKYRDEQDRATSVTSRLEQTHKKITLRYLLVRQLDGHDGNRARVGTGRPS